MFTKLRNLTAFILATTLALLNTIILPTGLFILTFFKLIIPIPKIKKWITGYMLALSCAWAKINKKITTSMTSTIFTVNLPKDVSIDSNYLILCNHQSWADITLLQSFLNEKVAFIRFFLKKNLIFLPFIGQACWALDFPFMHRYSKEYLAKYPEKRGKDLIATKKACERLKDHPSTVLNFLEGTRFTTKKHKKQNSPYKNLLRPKAGGLSYVLNSTRDSISKILNITIYYPDGKPNFFKLLSNQMNEVIINVEEINIDNSLYGDYINDPEYRGYFQNWVNKIWQEKDEYIEKLKLKAIYPKPFKIQLAEQNH